MQASQPTVEGLHALAPLFTHRPAYANALGEVWSAVWAQDFVDVETLELCRLRIGQLLGADPVADRVTDDWLTALTNWPTDPRFAGRPRIALEYAEQLLMDAQDVTDEQAAEVIDAFGEAGFLVLTYACGLFETTQRAALVIARLLPEGGPA
jgi:alkylhydroperoxidase family enzyme